MMTDITITGIENALSSLWPEFEQVKAAYLFGSHARGEGRAASDIDIAVIAPGIALDGYLKLWARVTKALETEKVDLVTLDDKPASFRFETIREGVVIYCKDADALNVFELRAWQSYMDGKHLRAIYLENLYEGLSSGL